MKIIYEVDRMTMCGQAWEIKNKLKQWSKESKGKDMSMKMFLKRNRFD